MIFKKDDIKEFKDALTITAEFNIEDLYSSIVNKGQDELLIPKGLGRALFLLVDAAYNGSDAMPARLAAILPKCQYIVANYAYMRYLPQAQVIISKEGVRITKSLKTSTAFQWQIDQFSDELSKSAFEGLEWLLSFLETNKTDYPEWVASDAYTLHTDCIIRSAKEFDSYVLINESRRTFMAMKYIQRRIEQTALQGMICEGLYQSIIAALNDTAGATGPMKNILPFIKRMVANYTVADALIELPVVVEATGVCIADGAKNQYNLNTAQATRLDRREQCLKVAEEAAASMMLYLYANIVDYPLFASSSCYVAPVTDSGTYQGNIIDTTGFSLL